MSYGVIWDIIGTDVEKSKRTYFFKYVLPKKLWYVCIYVLPHIHNFVSTHWLAQQLFSVSEKSVVPALGDQFLNHVKLCNFEGPFPLPTCHCDRLYLAFAVRRHVSMP